MITNPDVKTSLVKAPVLAALLLFPTLSNADDYGLKHTIGTMVVKTVTQGLVEAVHKDSPKLQKFLIGAITSYTAYRLCARESKARGGLPFNEWKDDYGSYDSNMDCLGPAAVATFTLYEVTWK